MGTARNCLSPQEMADGLSWFNTGSEFSLGNELEKQQQPDFSATEEIALDLPQRVKHESLTKIDTSMRLKDIDVAGFEGPSSSDWLSGASAAPTGKLLVYDQSTWHWPPPAGVQRTEEHDILIKSPRLYDPSASRNMDIFDTVESTNEASIAKIDEKAKQVESGILSKLDQMADLEIGAVEMSQKQYNTKLNDIAVLRRTFAGVIEGQVNRKEHQWAVKKKFYEADVESKRIFEEVQTRIRRETMIRMDEAKQEVALQIQTAAQTAMDNSKEAIRQRVDEQYRTARKQTQMESAQLYAEQLKQKEVLRTEFVARLKEHKKAVIRGEEDKAQAMAEDMYKKNRLQEEFRVFCLQNSDAYDRS